MVRYVSTRGSASALTFKETLLAGLAENDGRLTIVGATSGDTGGAALEAFKSCAEIDTFFLFPRGKVSDSNGGR